MGMVKKNISDRYKEFTNYTLVFFLIGVSGIPYFSSSNTNILLLFLFSFFIFLKRSILFDSRAFAIIIVFFIVDIAQAVFLSSFAPVTMMGTYFRLFLAFFIVVLSGGKFTRYYSDIIYWLSIIGFIFFIPSVLSQGFYNFFTNVVCPHFPALFATQSLSDFYDVKPTIIIYTFHEVLRVDFRNSGPFWEPGAYAIFIIIAMVFNIIETKQLWSKRNIVLAVAIASTLSTTGFIAFFILIMSYYFVTGNMLKNIIILAIAIPVGTGLYYNLEFMHGKIDKNIELDDDNTSRVGSGLADMKDFLKNPIIGWGRGEMRYGGKRFSFFTVDQHRNNGLAALLASYGIIVAFTLLYNYYKTFKTLCISYGFNLQFALLSLLILLVMSMGQTIFQYPFFYSIMFVHLACKKEKQELT
jgi:hypothetical protein